MNRRFKPTFKPRSRNTGFTLIEFFWALMITGALIAVAIPTYTSTTKSNRIVSQSNGLLGIFLLARSEAVKRGETVSVCQSTTGTGCESGKEWHEGWIMFENSNDDGVRTSDEALIRIGEELDGGNLIYTSSNIVSFNAQGLAASFNEFEICDGDSAYEDRFFKVLMVNQTGRAKLSDTTSTGATPTCD